MSEPVQVTREFLTRVDAVASLLRYRGFTHPERDKADLERLFREARSFAAGHYHEIAAGDSDPGEPPMQLAHLGEARLEARGSTDVSNTVGVVCFLAGVALGVLCGAVIG